LSPLHSLVPAFNDGCARPGACISAAMPAFTAARPILSGQSLASREKTPRMRLFLASWSFRLAFTRSSSIGVSPGLRDFRTLHCLVKALTTPSFSGTTKTSRIAGGFPSGILWHEHRVTSSHAMPMFFRSDSQKRGGRRILLPRMTGMWSRFFIRVIRAIRGYCPNKVHMRTAHTTRPDMTLRRTQSVRSGSNSRLPPSPGASAKQVTRAVSLRFIR